jgi:serpin B
MKGKSMQNLKKLLLLSIASIGIANAASTVPAPMKWWVESQPLGGSPIVKGLNNFAHNLYQKLDSTNKNSFFSPYSISTALSMAYVGARKETEKEMNKILGSTLPQEQFTQQNGNLLHILKDSVGLNVANKLFVGTKILPSFQNKTKIEYQAEADKVDFSKGETAANAINNWVSKETNEKIKKIISKDDLDNGTKMVIANAIYFKEEWKYPFDPNKTENAPFFIEKNRATNARTMTQEKEFFYMENETLQMLELPYKNDNLSMVILLPKKIDGLTALKNSITYEKISDWQTKLRPKKVFVKLPKFKLETNYKLNEPLRSLGMVTAFREEDADFSGIVGVTTSLYISNVLHKAYIDVTEKGTEASAATAVIMRSKCLGPFRMVSTIFNADHPFMFIIRENNTGLILFMGSVLQP